MQIVRTIIWVLVLVALLLFSLNNWHGVEVKIWENLVLETKLPVLVLTAFLMGMLPTWLVLRAHRWQSSRRITTLERNQIAVTQPPVTQAAQPAAAPPLSATSADPITDPIPPLM